MKKDRIGIFTNEGWGLMDSYFAFFMYGHEFHVHKAVNQYGWIVSEWYSGMRVGAIYDTRSKAVSHVKAILESKGEKAVKDSIKEAFIFIKQMA